MSDEDDLLQNALRNEYNVVSSNWRFFVGLRFIMLAFSATLLSTLMGAYEFAVENPELVGPATARAIPIFGLSVTIFLFLIETRTRNLYSSCIDRGIEIEDLLNIAPAHFQKLRDTPRRFWFVSQTWMIRFIYVTVGSAWIFLFLSR